MVPECRPNNPFPANSTGNPNWKQAKEKAGGSESRLNSKKDTICGADRLANLICNAMSRSEPIKKCVTLPDETNQQRQMLVQQGALCLTFPFPCTYICVCYKRYANTTPPPLPQKKLRLFSQSRRRQESIQYQYETAIVVNKIAVVH